MAAEAVVVLDQDPVVEEVEEEEEEEEVEVEVECVCVCACTQCDYTNTI